MAPESLEGYGAMTPTRDWRWHHLLSALLLTGAMMCIAGVVALEVLALVITVSVAALS